MDYSRLSLPDWVNWIAQDANGVWWGYQVEPLQNHHGWYENEVGQIIELARDNSNIRWHESLKKIS